MASMTSGTGVVQPDGSRKPPNNWASNFGAVASKVRGPPERARNREHQEYSTNLVKISGPS